MFRKLFVFALMGMLITAGYAASCFAANELPSALEGIDAAAVRVMADDATSDQGLGWSPNNFPKGQCTWWVDGRTNERGWRLKFSKSSGRDAYRWWDLVTNAKKGYLGLTGDIMVLDRWTGNSYGHVGSVESTSGNGTSWNVSHANFNAGSKYRTVDGVTIRLVTAKKVSSNRVTLGGNASYPLRGFLYKK